MYILFHKTILLCIAYFQTFSQQLLHVVHKQFHNDSPKDPQNVLYTPLFGSFSITILPEVFCVYNVYLKPLPNGKCLTTKQHHEILLIKHFDV